MSYGEQKPASESSGKAVTSLILGLFSFFCMFITGLPAVLLGVWALFDISSSQGRRRGTGLAIAGIVLGGIGTLWTCIGVALLLPAVQAAREAARRQHSMNNLQQIGIAIHNYHDTFKAFPMVGSNDPEFGVQHSWRVRIMPFIQSSPLFEQFDFNEPWDSPNNMAVLESMPAVYQTPNRSENDFKTVYLAIVGTSDLAPDDQPAFSSNPTQTTRFSDLLDGSSNVILIVEADADQAVLWTKPDDLVFDPENPRRGLGNLRRGGFLALFADGSVQFISETLDDESVRRLMSRADGHPVNF